MTEPTFWCTSIFDTCLIKYWDKNIFEEFKKSISKEPDHLNIIHLLDPSQKFKTELTLSGIFDDLKSKSNLCDRFKFCQSPKQHSRNLLCVTAAGLRERLSVLNSGYGLQIFDEPNYQKLECGIEPNFKKHYFSILLYEHIQDKSNPVHIHIKEMLKQYFVVVQAFNNPDEIDQNRDKANRFIRKQIFRNSDCILILNGQHMQHNWNNEGDKVTNFFVDSIPRASFLNLAIIDTRPLGPDEDKNLNNIIQQTFFKIHPLVITYQMLSFAPCSIPTLYLMNICKNKKAKDIFQKYWCRFCSLFYVPSDTDSDKSD